VQVDRYIRMKTKGKTFLIPEGIYIYIGSAKGGLKTRLKRHSGCRKRLHWHIDYLLENKSTHILGFYIWKDKEESEIVKELQRLNGIDGFGASDSRWRTHLFHWRENAVKNKGD